LLREDNADLRLTEIGYQLGCVSEHRYVTFNKKRESIIQEQSRLKSTWIQSGSIAAKEFQAQYNTSLDREYNVMELLRRPEINYAALMSLATVGPGIAEEDVAEQIDIQAKYAGYIQRQEKEIDKQKHYENTVIPADFDYEAITSLSAEVKQKLKHIKPQSIGQASRISGVTPAAISLLLVFLQR
jgi:tRNA uridine 5-carboxymethylaminomethyl modification enzyme